MERCEPSEILEDLSKGIFSVSGYRAIENLVFKSSETAGSYVSKYLDIKTRFTLIAVYLKNLKFKECSILTQGRQSEPGLFINEIKRRSDILKANEIIIAHNYYDPSQLLVDDILKASNTYRLLADCGLNLIDYFVCEKCLYRSVMRPYEMTFYKSR